MARTAKIIVASVFHQVMFDRQEKSQNVEVEGT
jgi:hypothetical protein